MCYLAGVFAESLRNQIERLNKDSDDYLPKDAYSFSKEEVLCAEIAGLCHDLGIIHYIIISNLYYDECMVEV